MWAEFCDVYSPSAEKERELRKINMVTAYEIVSCELDKIKANTGWYNENKEEINKLVNAFRIVTHYLENKIN